MHAQTSHQELTESCAKNGASWKEATKYYLYILGMELSHGN